MQLTGLNWTVSFLSHMTFVVNWCRTNKLMTNTQVLVGYFSIFLITEVMC